MRLLYLNIRNKIGTKHPYRRVPNNLCRHSPFQKVEFDSLLFECGLRE